MTSLAAAILDFQIFSNSNVNTEISVKTTFSDWNLQNCKIHCKVISIQAKIVTFLAKKCIFVVNTQVARLIMMTSSIVTSLN